MYQFDWGDISRFKDEGIETPSMRSELNVGLVSGVMLLFWSEHCLECGPPLCYENCKLFVARPDQKCARFFYGIIRNPNQIGLLNYGADLRFRRWGKLEAKVKGRVISPRLLFWLDKVNALAVALVNVFSKLFLQLSPKRRLNGAWTVFRGWALSHIGRANHKYDAFVLECFSFESQAFRLNIELTEAKVLVFRQSILLEPGRNFFSLNIPLPKDLCQTSDHTLKIFPEGDREARVLFTWLDFIQFKSRGNLSSAHQATQSPAPKIKCVAWDLDNTVWEGILVEDGLEGLALRPNVVELIQKLDERGILQTVLSKNNHDDAMAALKHFKLDEYFVRPAINWGQKSVNIKHIADHLNINIDTFAFIDDSPFERSEVLSTWPAVMVFPHEPLDHILTLPEFCVPVSSESRQRRHSYMTEAKRSLVQEAYSDNYLDFLRSCNLTLKLFVPSEEEAISRCLELIQRANQLNLSGKRYGPDELLVLLTNPNFLCVAMQCEDRFGNYGIIGFASVERSLERIVVKDFVLSCRVAQKHVEHSFYGWLAQQAKYLKLKHLFAELVISPKNAPLAKVFGDLGFITIHNDDKRALLSLDIESMNFGKDIVVGLDSGSIPISFFENNGD